MTNKQALDSGNIFLSLAPSNRKATPPPKTECLDCARIAFPLRRLVSTFDIFANFLTEMVYDGVTFGNLGSVSTMTGGWLVAGGAGAWYGEWKAVPAKL